MKIHEFQAKQLLAAYGVPVPRGKVAASSLEAEQAARELGGSAWVVKAQVHAGGRGKGGGILRAGSPGEVGEAAALILSRPLVTPQTGPAGRTVRRVLVEQVAAIERELYLGLTLDRNARRLVLMASPAGGMEIEEVAARSPELIHRVLIDPVIGLAGYQARWLAVRLELVRDGALERFVDLASALYRLYTELDCSLVEVNPLVVTPDGELVALDAKLTFDPAGLVRHPQIAELHDPQEEDPREQQAAQAGLSYVSLDGTIGCMVNGAGLAMATMDLILHQGGRPANFLDVGGAATSERVATALGLILDDPRVSGVLVNIFGGIVRCDLVADGIVAAARGRQLHVPMVVRLVGTNEAEGQAILERSGLPITPVHTMAEGALAITKAIRTQVEEAQ